MYLLIESMEDVRLEPIYESVGESNERRLFLEGPFLQSEEKNRNGRVYPKQLLEKAVDEYMTNYVLERRALGEINHPERPQVDLKEACLITENLFWSGNLVYGKAQVLNNPHGIIIKSLIDANFKLGVSSRGVGDVQRRNDATYVTKYRITAIDAVDNPSAQVAYVRAINESVSYEEVNGVWVPSKNIDLKKLENNIDRLIETMKKKRT